VRLSVSTNEELNQELEKTLGTMTSLHQNMWQQQLNSAPNFSLYRAYELQSDICLSIHVFERGQKLSQKQWEEAWEMSAKFDNM